MNPSEVFFYLVVVACMIAVTGLSLWTLGFVAVFIARLAVTA